MWKKLGKKLWERQVKQLCKNLINEVKRNMDLAGLAWLGQKCREVLLGDPLQIEEKVNSQLKKCEDELLARVMAKFRTTFNAIVLVNVLRLLRGQADTQDALASLQAVVKDSGGAVQRLSTAVGKVDAAAASASGVAAHSSGSTQTGRKST